MKAPSGFGVASLALAAALLTLLMGAPTAFVWFDQLHHWDLVRSWIEGGAGPSLRGATVSGIGRNGPLYHWLLAVGLSIVDSEVGMAWFTTALAACGITAAALLAGRRWGRQAIWVFAVVVSHPVLVEWIRVGEDFSYLPALLPLLILGWLRIERAPAGPVGWLLWGILCGAALQLHVTTAPALAIASLWLWRPRLAPWAPLLTVVGVTLTYVTIILDPRWTAIPMTWADIPGTAAALLEAVWRATVLRAEQTGAPSWLGAWPTGVLLLAAALSPLAGRRGARRMLAMAAAALLFVSFDESAHYHHLMHLDVVLASLLAAGALTLARGGVGRGVLLVAVAWQVFVSGTNILAASRTGILEQYSSYPLRWPGVREEAATAALRDALRRELAASGLRTPADREMAVLGDTLVFSEHAWSFLGDPLADSLQSPALENRRFALRRGPCGNREGRPLPGHCFLTLPDGGRAADPVVLTSVVRPFGPVDAQALRGAHAVGAGVFPRQMAPLVVLPAPMFPLHVESTPGRDIRAVTIRQFRIPQTDTQEMDLLQGPPGRPIPPTTVAHGHLLYERVWTFPSGVTSVRLALEDRRGVAAFHLEVERADP